MDILWRLLVWFIPILVNVYADRKGRKPNYVMMFILRAFVAILHGALFVNDYQNYWYYWWPVLVFETTSFWIFFELGLNLFYNYYTKEKRSLFYYDKKEGDSGTIDRIFKYLGDGAHTAAKLTALAMMLFSIVLIYQRGIQP